MFLPTFLLKINSAKNSFVNGAIAYAYILLYTVQANVKKGCCCCVSDYFRFRFFLQFFLFV